MTTRRRVDNVWATRPVRPIPTPTGGAMAAAATKKTQPKVITRFRDNSGNRVAVIKKVRTDDFVVYVEHRPASTSKGDAPVVQRGMGAVFINAPDADAEVKRLVDGLVKEGWRRSSQAPPTDFTSLPKANNGSVPTAAAPAPTPARKTASK